MKRILSVLLALMLCVGLLPISVFAEPTKLNSVDIVIELPNGGDPFDLGYVPTITSFTSGDIDLLATGAGILKTDWVGDVVIGEDGTPFFRGGTAYQVSIKLALNIAAGYCANYVMSNGEYLVGPDTFSATVNGIPATITRNNPPYFPTVEVSLTLPGEAITEEEKVEISAEEVARIQEKRELKASRTWAEASEADTDNLPEKLCIMNATVDFGNNGFNLDNQETAFKAGDVTKVIFDSDFAAGAAQIIPFKVALKEVWVADGMDILKFYRNMIERAEVELYSQCPFNRADGMLFISESAASVLKEKIGSAYYPAPAFTIKVYSGSDVYAAQKAGASATKDFCTNHKYTMQSRAVDRIYTFASCKTSQLYYYSCETCGKCECDPNHVNFDISMSDVELEHAKNSIGVNSTYDTELPNDSAYIGVNAAGQHVWWKSCNTCGRSVKYDMLYSTDKDENASALAGLERREEQILNSTDIQPDTFTLSRKSNVNMSEWAQSDVNWALNENLLDSNLLGSDYTQNISRLQFCSVAVKLAEELTGNSIAPANDNTFADTNDAYALKAYAAGITSGVTATTFDPNGMLSRQQMATFLYRTLRYVENNSDYKYTTYNSKLDSYTDSWAVQSWANEAMAFMNALDLVKGNTDTSLDPDGLCTIEQAVAVAERSVYAHQIGWYQVKAHYYMVDYDGTKRGEGSAHVANGCRLPDGKYIWVTGRRFDLNYVSDVFGNNVEHGSLPFVNTYTGQIMGIDYQDVIPIRD